MASNVQPPHESQQSSTVYVVDQQTRARARTGIGLDPERETAPAAISRPPDDTSSRAQWLLFACVALLGVAVLLLLLAPLLGANSALTNFFGTQVSVQSGVVPPTLPAPALPSYLTTLPGYQLWLNDSFDAPSQLTQERTGVGQVASSVLVDRGVYRIQTPPNQLGWTLFDLAQTTSYHLETSALLSPASVGGAAGVIARFAGSGNFYLLSVDNAGSIRVQLWRDGAPNTSQSSAVRAFGAGQANRLAVEDDGTRIRFYVNEVLVDQVLEPQLPFGRPGIAAVAAVDQEAVVDYDWIAIYRPQE